MPDLLSYAEVLKQLGEKRAYILLGNGFSIGCDPVFSYGRLYDAAREAGLSGRAQEVFGRLGTNNFEGVLRLLDDTKWVGRLYGLSEDGLKAVEDDLRVVKETLVSAVAKSHLDHAGLVSDAKKAAALAFLKRFHHVFTTNYDLVLYWVAMSEKGEMYADGFRAPTDEPDAPYLVFSERLGDTQGLFYIHGALHLYLAGGELRKHSWIRTGERLTDQIRAGLDAGQYPLFVSEGSAEMKLDQIQRHGYLWYSLDKLARIESPLVVYGHSLGVTDSHLVDTIARDVRLPAVFLGLHGDLKSDANQAIVEVGSRMVAAREQSPHKGKRALEVRYYQAESAGVWG